MLCTDCPDAADCSGSCCCTQEPEPVELVTCANGPCDGCDGSCDCGEHDVEPVVPVEPVAPPVTCAMIVAHVELSSQRFTCLTFASVVEAERFLTDRFGYADNNGRWRPDDDDDMRTYADDFFLEYWDECGGINAFTINAAQHGKPFTAF